MNDIILQEISEDGSKRVSIYYDEDPCDSPRDWDTFCHMICEHRRYSLGDTHSGAESELHQLCEKYNIDWEGDWEKDNDEMSIPEMMKALSEYIVIRPISIYDHSGVAIFWGTSFPFDCGGWDTSNIGFGYCEESDVEQAGRNENQYPNWRDQAIAIMDGEMETYDKYIRGKVYGWKLEERRAPTKELMETPEWDEFLSDYWEENFGWEEIDSCWGCYDEPDVIAKDVIAGKY